VGGAVLIGAVSGLRSQLGVAGVAATTAPGQLPGGTSALAHPAAKGVSAALAVGELVTDKLPSTPDRRTPLGLGPRAVAGATAAAALASRAPDASVSGRSSTGRPPPRSRRWPEVAVATVLGSLAAVGGAYAGAAWRQARAAGGHADWPAALAEDAVALALTWAATTRVAGH
jgi:uncharacterized membrane protein